MDRKKYILLLSYYAPPLNAINSQRAYTLAKQLAKNGFVVDLVTKHWNGNENTWEDMLQSNFNKLKVISEMENFTIHYLPYKSELKRITKFVILKKYLVGNINVVVDTSQFIPYLNQLAETNQYDFIYTTSPPENIINTAYEIASKYNIPYILDFRDFFNEIILKKKSKNVLGYIKRFSFTLNNKAILKNAFLITTASEPFTDYIKKVYKTSNVLTVLNGYEKEMFNNLIEKKNNNKFVISCIGTLYPHQILLPLLNGVNLFCEQHNYKTIELNFIGAASIKEIEIMLSSIFNNQANITSKISRMEALKIGKNSDILIYSAWKGYKGVYSGKIFEYLGLKKNILIAPKDNDVIDEILNETLAGKSFGTPEEVLNYLNEKYQEWISTKSVAYHGIEVEIEKYSREYQNNKIINMLNESVSIKQKRL